VLNKNPNLTTVNCANSSPVLVALIKAIAKTRGIRAGKSACYLVAFNDLHNDLAFHVRDGYVESISSNKSRNNYWLRTTYLCFETQFLAWRFVVVNPTITATPITSRHKLPLNY